MGGGLLSGVSGRWALNCQELVRGGLLSEFSGFYPVRPNLCAIGSGWVKIKPEYVDSLSDQV